MTTGDQTDMVARLKAMLPSSWFASITPVKDALLAGIAQMSAGCFSLITYVRQQGRVLSASGVFLDLAALDYTGRRVTRRLEEGDDSFRTRLLPELLPSGATRAALVARLTSLTGHVPVIFEPTQPMDTGAYGYGGLGYGVAGGYGSLALPFQAFVSIQRPVSQGVPYWGGYNGNNSMPVYAPGGYGVGLLAYSDITQAFDGVTDADIYQTVATAQAAGVIGWTRIHA